LTTEQLKINEKEVQIEKVKKQIELIVCQRKEDQNRQLRKAVRIQEPDDKKEADIAQIHADLTSDSGYVSTRNSKPSDIEISESYL